MDAFSLFATLGTAVIVSIAAPAVLLWLQGRQRQADKAQEWARQDAVSHAAKVAAAEVARLASVDRQQVKARGELLLKVNSDQLKVAEDSAAVGAATLAKVEIVHTLVNSAMTSALQAELSSTRRELALLKEYRGPAEAIQVATVRIGELEALLEDRARQQALADEQAKALSGVQQVSIVPDADADAPLPVQVVDPKPVKED